MPVGGFSGYSFQKDSSASTVDPMILEAQGRRLRLAEAIAPSAMADPSALAGITSLAQSASDDESFIESVMSVEGFNEAGRIAADLQDAPDDVAYAQYTQLPKQMQAAVRQAGFTPEGYGSLDTTDGKASGLFGSIPLIGGGLADVTGAIGERVFHPTGELFAAGGRVMTQAFRAKERAQEMDNGWFGALDPTNYKVAWSDVGNGATYVAQKDRQTLRDNYGIDDRELDQYLELSQGKLPGELAEDEGLRIGSAEHTERVAELYELASSDLGIELVGDPLNSGDGMLNNYRVSAGRSLARGMSIQPADLDNGWGKRISGAGDLTFAIFADPTLVGGKFMKLGRWSRRAMRGIDDLDKAVDAARAARAIRAGGRMEEVGGRVVRVLDAGGNQVSELAKSRLAYGHRVNDALDMVSAAFRGGDEGDVAFQKMVQAQPNMLDAWPDLTKASRNLINDNVGDGLGLASTDGIINFLGSNDGYTILAKTRLGGRNTSMRLELPELGRAGMVRVQAKGVWDKTIDWSQKHDSRLAEEIGTADGRFGQLLKAAASPIKTTQRAGLAPLQFAHLFTTHVPHAGFIGLYADNAVAEFERFTQLGRRVGMTSDEVNTYVRDFAGRVEISPTGDSREGLLGVSGAQRAGVIREFNIDLLKRFAIPETSPLYEKFVKGIDEIYGLTPEGEAKAGLAVLSAQTSKAMAIPRMRELVMATNRYSVTRSLIGRGGIANPAMIDSALTKVWKPLVLMRMGFISRAAGEELLAYAARYGSMHYVGTQLALDSRRKLLHDGIIDRIDDVPTKENMRGWMGSTPEEWEGLMGWSGPAGAAPGAREVMTWGQSQALTPLTGAIHAFDGLLRKAWMGEKIADNAVPAYAQRILDRSARLDSTVLHSSIRFAKTNKKVAAGINKTIQRAPGLHRSAMLLDNVLAPIKSRYGMNTQAFMDIANSTKIPTKDQFGKLFAHITDEDMLSLDEMLTDPIIRKAQVEELGGSTFDLNNSATGRESEAQFLPTLNSKHEVVMREALPVGNKQSITARPDGELNPQLRVDYMKQNMQRIRQIWDERIGLDKAILTSLPNHFSSSMVDEITASLARHPLSGIDELEDIEQVRRLASAFRSIPVEYQKEMYLASTDGTLDTVSREIAAKLLEPDDINAVLAVGAITDPAAHSPFLNPSLNPALITDSWEQTLDRLRQEVHRVGRRPAGAQAIQGWQHANANLAKGVIEGTLPAYTVAGDRTTSAWALQHLNSATDPGLEKRFIEELGPRLERRHMEPELARQIANQLFDPQTPMGTIHQTWRAAHRPSTPLSLMGSVDNQLMDEVVNVLEEITGKRFHLQRMDIPEDVLTSRSGQGTAKLLDGKGNPQQATLYRLQMEDMAGGYELPPGTRRTMVEAPNPRVDVYDTTFGPPEGEIIQTVGPQKTTWSMGGPDDDMNIWDMANELPPIPDGRGRMFGWARADDDTINWSVDDIRNMADGIPDEPVRWYFADVEESRFMDLGQEALEENPDLLSELTALADEVGPKKFATDYRVDRGVDEAGDEVSGWSPRADEFDYDELVDIEQWQGRFSPQHYVAEKEEVLRRLATVNSRKLVDDEITEELLEVAKHLGFPSERLMLDGISGNIVRHQVARQADKMLIEGRAARALPQRRYVHEDELEEIATSLGGPLQVEDVDQLLDIAEDALASNLDEGLLWPEVAEGIQARLDLVREFGGNMNGEAVLARRAIVEDLDELVPGWKGAEGWARQGTNEWFGLSEVEPSPLTPTRKHFSVGASPGDKTNQVVDDQVEEIVRYLTNARSGSGSPERVLHEILTPLGQGGKKNLDLDVLSRPHAKQMPLEVSGQVYATKRTFAWDRLTNFWFDDVAGKAISSIVRTPLFATNFIEASRVTKGIAERLQDPALRVAMAPIMQKLGLDVDDLDQMVQLERYGMLSIPHPEGEQKWFELLDEADQDMYMQSDAFLAHDSPVDSWGRSGLRPPNYRMGVAEANRMLRQQLGLTDTPMNQAIREKVRVVHQRIDDQAHRIVKDAEKRGATTVEAQAEAKAWRDANSELHEETLKHAADKAVTEVGQARDLGQQLQSDPALVKARNQSPYNQGDPTFEPDDLVQDLSSAELAMMRRYMNARTNALDTARDAAMGRAFEGVIPFIDDFRIRSQFQEYVGNIVPFWFAEEQFLKRWTRIIKESPEVIRKGQLLMQGLRSSGFVKKDMDGNEYYVIPGSAAATSFLAETPVANLLFGSDAVLPVGMALTGDVKYTLPGFGDQVGVPSAGPFVGIGLEMLASRSPEWAKVQTAVMGERGSNRPLASFLVPTSVQRVYDAIVTDIDEGQLATAAIQVAQLMEASGQGLKDDATPDERQDYIDKVEANTRTVLLMRSVVGFWAPASPQISAELPLASEFQMLLQSGVPYTEALAMFASKHEGDISPYTVFKSEAPAGAPMASTQEALEAMDMYSNEIRRFPMAAPWMLLPFRTNDDEFDNRAYRTQIRSGLRKTRSLGEYIDALAWADASPEYFEKLDDFDSDIEAFTLMEDDELVRQTRASKTAWTTAYKNTHPSFADKLSSSDGRTERQQILRQSYLLMLTPAAANSSRQRPMRAMLEKYRDYDDALVGLNSSRAKAVVQRKDEVEAEFMGWIGLHLRKNPELRYFYDRVLRPELRWETKDEGGI